MKVRFKKIHKDAVIPTRAHVTDTGFDLTAVTLSHDLYGKHYGFGIAVEIPEGHVGFIFPRSSIYKKEQLLSNSVGVIDCDYTGEISAVFYSASQIDNYDIGDRVAQLIIMPIPSIEFEEVEELGNSERGVGGYGSTGE